MQEVVRSPNLKYPWQRAVLDAFMEFRPEYLPPKINAAEQVVSARLCDPTPADAEERIALQDALKSLRVLVSEPKPSQKKKIA